MEDRMMEKLARTGIAAIALAGVMAYGGLSAHGGPKYAVNTEYLWTYYNNASHSTEVGYWDYGCAGTYSSGTRTIYYTEKTYMCNTGPDHKGY
jgi:hypothetical protein